MDAVLKKIEDLQSKAQKLAERFESNAKSIKQIYDEQQKITAEHTYISGQIFALKDISGSDQNKGE